MKKQREINKLFELLPIGDKNQLKELKSIYKRALEEKFNLENVLNNLEIGDYGRIKLQKEIAKLTDILIRADENIFVITIGKILKKQKQITNKMSELDKQWFDIWNTSFEN